MGQAGRKIGAAIISFLAAGTAHAAWIIHGEGDKTKAAIEATASDRGITGLLAFNCLDADPGGWLVHLILSEPTDTEVTRFNVDGGKLHSEYVPREMEGDAVVPLLGLDIKI